VVNVSGGSLVVSGSNPVICVHGDGTVVCANGVPKPVTGKKNGRSLVIQLPFMALTGNRRVDISLLLGMNFKPFNQSSWLMDNKVSTKPYEYMVKAVQGVIQAG
jgi:hypothetical protein